MGKKLHACHDRIVVEPVDAREKPKGGLVLPDTAKTPKDLPCLGKVVAVGPGRLTDYGVLVPIKSTVGQMIIYSRYANTEFWTGGKCYHIIRDAEVQAWIEETEDVVDVHNQSESEGAVGERDGLEVGPAESGDISPVAESTTSDGPGEVHPGA